MAPAPTRAPVFAVVGNPNCGKSTLFNALTGLKQKVGNYPGVTVEKKVGQMYSQHGQMITIVDLPGAYSLAARSPDEAVLRDVLFGSRPDMQQPDRIICILDASNLERNLYLLHQVLDLGRPVIAVLNMMDLAKSAGITIDVPRLERELGIPVIPCEAANGKGLLELKLAMSRFDLPLSRHSWDVPAPIAAAVSELQVSLITNDGKQPLIARAEALLLLTDQDPIRVEGSAPLSARTQGILASWKARWSAAKVDWAGSLVETRYLAIAKLCKDAVQRSERVGRTLTDRIDSIVVHRVWGWFVLLAMMTLLFLSIFTLAEKPMNWIDEGVAALGTWVKGVMPPGDLRDLIADGAIAGVGGVLVFLPQILILFLFIGLLESSGYMARAAFIMDRLMSKVGLHGKSFIPLLSSYACAIPGIMATRTIENAKDRLVTILVAPLMSCSARLPVYLLMIAALLPGERVSVGAKVGLMVLMYVLGTLGTFGFAWLFKKTILRGETPMMLMELPPYRAPRVRDVLYHMGERAWIFVRRAGTVILGISIVMWFLSTYPKHPELSAHQDQVSQSFAGMAGRSIEPAIKPLGFDWRVGFGLLSSFAAREVFVSSMGVIFGVEATGDDTTPLRTALVQAKWPDGAPLFTPLVCLTLMVFYVFAMQCISTIVVVRRETNSWRWPIFQIVYMTGTAWLACFIIYQGGRALGF